MAIADFVRFISLLDRSWFRRTKFLTQGVEVLLLVPPKISDLGCFERLVHCCDRRQRDSTLPATKERSEESAISLEPRDPASIWLRVTRAKAEHHAVFSLWHMKVQVPAEILLARFIIGA